MERKLNTLYWNCNGFKNFLSMDTYEQQIVTNFEVICICESWVYSDISERLSGSENYQLFSVKAT